MGNPTYNPLTNEIAFWDKPIIKFFWPSFSLELQNLLRPYLLEINKYIYPVKIQETNIIADAQIVIEYDNQNFSQYGKTNYSFKYGTVEYHKAWCHMNKPKFEKLTGNNFKTALINYTRHEFLHGLFLEHSNQFPGVKEKVPLPLMRGAGGSTVKIEFSEDDKQILRQLYYGRFHFKEEDIGKTLYLIAGKNSIQREITRTSMKIEMNPEIKYKEIIQ